MRKRFFWKLLLVLLSASLVGCNGVEDEGVGPNEAVVSVSNPERDGLVGITFQNGVECLGEEALPIAGDSVFVSPSGDDSNAGDTETAPFGTLAYALCNLRPGQTLHVLPGIYRESVIMGAFGDAGASVTIRGVMQGDQRPVLDGESTRTMGIGLVESTNIIIQNLEFRNYTDEGVNILLGSDFVVRNNLFIANGRASIDPDLNGEGFGINVDGASAVLIEGNQAINNGPNEELWKKYILGMGINTYELRDSIIRDNDSHNNIGGGILVEDSINVLVENNRISGNELDANGDYWDGGIWVDGGENITLRGNIITDNHGPGLNLSDEDVQYPDASVGYVVEDNIVTGNVFGVYSYNFGQCPVPDDAIHFSDNQIEDNSEQDFWCVEWQCGEGEACE